MFFNNGLGEPSQKDWQNKWANLSMRSGQLMQKFMARHPYLHADDITGFDPLNMGEIFIRLSQSMLQDSSLLLKLQLQWWQGYMDIWRSSLRRGVGENSEEKREVDRRFKDEAWQNNVLYHYLKESYLLSSEVLLSAVKDVRGFDEQERRRLAFYTKQFTDALSPSNFAFMNPEVMNATYESGGENLVQGLENLLEDLEEGEGRLKISMTDENAFEVGVNIATTAGKVVFQNELLQLIQYEPLTEKVDAVPLLIVPPWINKYYILDLNEKKSFVRFALSQGLTVFIISWVNPDAKLRDKDFSDYMSGGLFAVIDAICDGLGVSQINAVGYCIGGTLLATSLAYMAAKGDERVVSATYLTTLLDFSNAGDLQVFIDEQQLKRLEEKMDEIGYLEGEEMARTFNLLRSNDLIWSFVVNNYLLGKDPLPFDLLYWNSDSTRMPAAMHSYYLRRMYLENLLCKAGGLNLLGEDIDLGKVKIPSFVLSTREDHIAPWHATYEAVHLFSGSVKFVLAGSGHIAGVVNPPEVEKYCYWEYNRRVKSADAWLEKAEQHKGSWWPLWRKWLGKFGGGKVAARVAGKGKLSAIEPAPGSYVKVRGQPIS